MLIHFLHDILEKITKSEGDFYENKEGYRKRCNRNSLCTYKQLAIDV